MKAGKILKVDSQFDPERFEQLTGPQLGFYALGLAKRGIFPPDCIHYFKTNANRWDGQHLEAGLMFLGEMRSPEAAHEIVNCIGHHLKHIRWTVLFMLNSNKVTYFDDYMLSKIEEQIRTVTEESERRFINDVYIKAKGKKLAREK